MGKARVSIRTILIASFCGLTISSLALLLWLGVTVVKQNTTTLLSVITDSTMGAVSSRVEDQIEPIYKQLDYLQEQLQGDWFQQLTKKEKMVFFQAILAGTKHVHLVGFVPADKTHGVFFHRSLAISDNSAVIIKVGESLFNQSIVKPHQNYWLPMIRLQDSFDSMLPVARPVFQQGKHIGFVIVMVSLQELQYSLSEIRHGNDLFSLYMRNSENILTLSNPLVDKKPGAMEKALKVTQHLLDSERTSVSWLNSELCNVSKIKGIYKNYLLCEVALQIESDGWHIGMFIDETVMAPELQRVRWLIASGLGMVILFTLVAFFLGKYLANGVTRIVDAFNMLRRRGIDADFNLSTTMVKEFDEASTAYQHMLASLKRNAKVQRLFGLYVPEAVALELINADGELKPKSSMGYVVLLYC